MLDDPKMTLVKLPPRNLALTKLRCRLRAHQRGGREVPVLQVPSGMTRGFQGMLGGARPQNGFSCGIGGW